VSLNEVMADLLARQYPHLYGPEAISAQPEDGHLVPPLLADQVTGYITVSNEMLMDCGVIPDTRPRPVLTRRERFARWRREKAASARMAVAGRAYRLISGEDVPEQEY
jgi:hypothetical protein